MTDLNTEPKQTARRGLAVYLASLAGLSLPMYLVMAGRAVPVAEQPALVVLLMWMPAVASIVARLTVRPPRTTAEGREPDPTGLRRLDRPVLGPIAVALAFPVVVGLLSYGFGWSTGLAAYVPGGETAGVQAAGGLPRLFADIGRALLIGVPFGLLIVAGEEIGWRGYMTLRLHEADLPGGQATGGLVWAAWHAPLIITGQYAGSAYPPLAVAAFAVLAVGLHLLWSSWRLSTGSLWPAIVAHSAWNTIIQGPFDGHTAGATASVWLGDSGLLTAGLCLAAAGVLLRARVR